MTEQDTSGNTDPGEVFKTKMKAVLIKYLLAAHRMDREWEARRLVNGAIAIIHS